MTNCPKCGRPYQSYSIVHRYDVEYARYRHTETDLCNIRLNPPLQRKPNTLTVLFRNNAQCRDHTKTIPDSNHTTFYCTLDRQHEGLPKYDLGR